MILRLDTCTVDLVTGLVSGTRPGALAPRELQLLRYLAERPEIEVSRDELLYDLFGYSRSVQSRAVDKAMSSLRSKVEAPDGPPRHLCTTPGGYRFVPRQEVPEQMLEVDAFVGRESELTELSALLADPGVVTLTGPGGTGKTRLARRAAAILSHRERIFCELAPAEAREDVLRAVANALGLSLSKGDAARQIGRRLAAQERLLLILDNFDRLVPHADLLRLWRQLAPKATFLLTSRRPTHLEGERVLRLPPLERAAAVALLTARAAERGIDVAGARELDEIAQRLDDLPLALELAASRLGVLAPAQLLERLDQRLDLLKSAVPGAPARLASLRGTLDWSWELLDRQAQTALAQLSVFVGDFGLEAAEQVLTAPADGRLTIEVLSELLDHSLVQRRGSEGELRFHLLETVRAYAAERLEALGQDERQRIEAAHGRWFARLQEQHPLRRIELDPSVRARVARELDNLLAAARRAVARGDAEVALATTQIALRVLMNAGSVATAVALVEAVLALPGLAVNGRAALAHAAAVLHRSLGQEQEAYRRCQDALAAARECGRQDIELRVLLEMGLLERGADRLERGRSFFEEALALARALDDHHTAGLALLNLAGTWFRLGRADRCDALNREALQLFRTHGDRLAEGRALGALGVSLLESSRLDEAERTLQEALAIAQKFGDTYQEALMLLNLGAVASHRGDHRAAIACLERTMALSRGAQQSLFLEAVWRLGESRCELGELQQGLRDLEEALEVARSLGSRLEEAKIQGALAYWETQVGREASALQRFHAAKELLAANPHAGSCRMVDLMFRWADLEADRGRLSEARQALAEARVYMARLPKPPARLHIKLDKLKARLEVGD